MKRFDYSVRATKTIPELFQIIDELSVDEWEIIQFFNHKNKWVILAKRERIPDSFMVLLWKYIKKRCEIFALSKSLTKNPPK